MGWALSGNHEGLDSKKEMTALSKLSGFSKTSHAAAEECARPAHASLPCRYLVSRAISSQTWRRASVRSLTVCDGDGFRGSSCTPASICTTNCSSVVFWFGLWFALILPSPQACGAGFLALHTFNGVNPEMILRGLKGPDRDHVENRKQFPFTSSSSQTPETNTHKED